MAVQTVHLRSGQLAPVEALELPSPERALVRDRPRQPVESVRGRLHRFSQHLAAVFALWAYPTSISRRDLRIDLLRGLCVFAMAADHLGGESWLYALTGGNRSFVSAAEGFMFISGLVVGHVYVAKIDRGGLARAVLQVFKRARTLYLATVVLTLVFSALRIYTQLALWVPRELSTGQGEQSVAEILVRTITLQETYHGTDILAMYVFCIAAAGGALALLSFGHWRWVLGASWLVWLMYQLSPARIDLPWYIHNSENFPLAAWQVLFMTGLVVGFHRRRLADRIYARPRDQQLIIVLAIAVSIATAWYFNTSGEAAMDVFDKVALRPARLLGFAAVAVLAYTLATFAWRPLERATGWLLLPLGQHALYCYVVHFLLILLVINVVPADAIVVPGGVSPVLFGTALQLGLVMMVWSFVRRRVLFGVVPN